MTLKVESRTNVYNACNTHVTNLCEHEYMLVDSLKVDSDTYIIEK